jgi:hypothetical protein
MSDIDFLFQGFGDVDSPSLAVNVGADELAGAFDPAQQKLLGFFTAVINAELAAAWEVSRVGTALAAKDPVADTLWRVPTKAALRAQSLSFPLLCVARVSDTSEELTLVREQITTTWSVDYILGPLTDGDYRRLGSSMSAARRFLTIAVRDRCHLAYESGAIQFGLGSGGLNTVRLGSSIMGPMDFGERGEGLEFHGLHIDLETTELDHFVDVAAAPYAGMTVHGHVGDAVQIVPELVVGRTP